MIEEMSPAQTEEFLRSQRIVRVGCHHDGLTYVVPVIYAWDSGSFYVFTTEGRKVTMMRASPRVCAEVDEYLASGSWKSVIVQGDFEELHGADADYALSLLRERLAPPPGTRRDVGDRSGGRATVAFRVRAVEITGRMVDRGPANAQ